MISRERLLSVVFVALALAGLAACASGSENYGPLAVLPDDDGGHDALGGTGPIHITETCVELLLPGGETVLPVWEKSTVQWDGGDREIIFSGETNSDESPLTIREGDVITLGGGSLVFEGAATQPAFPWVSQPHSTCGGHPFAVDFVARGTFP